MSDIEMLESLPIEDLRAELAAREARTRGALPALYGSSLGHIEDAVIVDVLRYRQKAIYLVDDRKDIYELPKTDPKRLAADSVVALFKAAGIKDNGDGTSTLVTKSFGQAQRLCLKERFRDQPVGGDCTGFLVAPDIIATAGHCVRAENVRDVRFVFGFEMVDQSSPRLIIKNGEIYEGA
ncbi:MAG: trypsin-like serine protease, partial [Pseudomonadota bacterium]